MRGIAKEETLSFLREEGDGKLVSGCRVRRTVKGKEGSPGQGEEQWGSGYQCESKELESPGASGKAQVPFSRTLLLCLGVQLGSIERLPLAVETWAGSSDWLFYLKMSLM